MSPDVEGHPTDVPNPSTSPEEESSVDCQRCGGGATNHYEGAGEYLDLCDDCLDDLADWLQGDDGE